MRPQLERAVGAILMSGAILGLLLSATGIGLLWWSEGHINRKVDGGAANLRRSLAATEDLLAAADDTLVRLESQRVTVAAALDSTARTTRGFGALAGGDAAQVVRDAQAALDAAATTARVVDDTLRVVSELPFVGGSRYRPDVPLSDSLAEVARSLDPLPAQLAAVERDLARTAEGIEAIGAALGTGSDPRADGRDSDVDAAGGPARAVGSSGAARSTEAAGPAGAEASIQSAREAIAAYRATVGDLERAAGRVEDDFARALRWFNLFATFLLLWLVIAQIGLLTQGYEWWRRGRL